MDCHEEKKSGGHNGHVLMMVLCCGLPSLVLAAGPFVVQFNPSLGRFLGSYSWLICPILMIPMLFMMLGSHKKRHE